MSAKIFSFNDDKMAEECGVFGIYAPGSNVAQLPITVFMPCSTAARKVRALPLRTAV